ncbi:MAG TPA: hypothetical protein VFR94_05800 [Nitrososphaeraceae archaeon]|nr:hypothetical protein [Nitrososphaeraceae archaeon]
MSESEVMHRISLSGRNGIKKTEVKKEFQHMPVDEIVESLLETRKLVMGKKGTAFYLWEAENYLQHILTTDTKFGILYRKIEELKVILESNVEQRMITPVSLARGYTSQYALDRPARNLFQDHRVAIDKDQFERDFRLILQHNSSTSGWVSLLKIREEMNEKYGVTREDFYSLVEEIANRDYETYELSSGGSEGITLRGLLHGFIRCI